MGKDAAVSASKAKQPLTSQKSMYTPVFYTPSQTNAIASSSTEGDSSRKGKGKEREKVTIPNLSSANLKRLEALSKRHIALNQVCVEVPDSRSNSEVSVEDESGKGKLLEDDLVKQDLEGGIEAKVARNARIRRLRTQIAAARAASGSNPAHGKWELVTRLVRLGVTSGGRRWVGARADRPPVDIGKEFNKSNGTALGWCNAETEEEWFEWERRFEHEMALKRRVAEWSKGVQPVAPEGGAEEEAEEDSDTAVAPEEDVPPPVSAPAPEPEPEPPVQTATVKRKKPLHSSGNALGFSMSKRTATASALRVNGKPSGSGKRISNVTDLSIPPPSFSESQIVTSTQVPRSPVAKMSTGGARPRARTPVSKDASANNHQNKPPSTPPIRRTYGKGSQSPQSSTTPRDLAKSPSMHSIRSPKSPVALRHAASLVSLSPSLLNNNPRSKVLVPLSPSRTMAALASFKTRNPTSPTASANPLKRKMSPVQVRRMQPELQDESVSKKQKLTESNATTQDSLYGPVHRHHNDTQLTTPTKQTVSLESFRRTTDSRGDLLLPPTQTDLPTLTDLLASAKKPKSPKKGRLRTNAIPMSALKDIETHTKIPPVDQAGETPTGGDSFGSIPGLTTSRKKSPRPVEDVVGSKAPSPPPFSIPSRIDMSPSNRPLDVDIDAPPEEYGIPDFNLDHISLPGLDGHGQDDGDGFRGGDSYGCLGMGPFASEGIYDGIDLSSPEKSLSSLAGSDSEDSDEEDEDEVSQNVLPPPSLHEEDEVLNVVGLNPANLSFNPQFASTQKEEQRQLMRGLPLSGNQPLFGISSSNPFLGNLALSQVSPARSASFGGLSPSKTYSSSQPSVVYGKYNSQFDVRSRVEEVDRLLERDLELESANTRGGGQRQEEDIFSGWLKDVDSEEEEEE